ncbi:MAG: DUF2971 domain-containing protein [Oscillospiraceae bacterium]|nr:DUF2971 domain-containing protein [Oscillospiraceae bacterium]
MKTDSKCSDWKIEYDKFILDGNSIQAKSIKENNINRSFFKYRCFDDNGYWLDWINGKVFLNSPSKFNDPFDCLISTTAETKLLILRDVARECLEEYVKLSKIDKKRLEITDNVLEAICIILEQHGEKINRKHINNSLSVESMEKREQSLFKNIFNIACFSEVNDSILMWSHYTNHHQGICIEYDFSKRSRIIEHFYPVTYSDKRFVLQPCHYKKRICSMPIVLCKAKEWAYEHEWRYVNIVDSDLNPPSDNSIDLSDKDSIKAIYIGVDAKKHNSDSVEKLLKITRKRNIPLYEMRFDAHEYKLNPHRIH